MLQFEGRAQFTTSDAHPFNAIFVIDEHRLRLRSGNVPIESWLLRDTHFARISLFRFTIDVGEEQLVFTPEDPTGFAAATNAPIDLRTRDRFGLAERLRNVESA